MSFGSSANTSASGRCLPKVTVQTSAKPVSGSSVRIKEEARARLPLVDVFAIRKQKCRHRLFLQFEWDKAPSRIHEIGPKQEMAERKAAVDLILKCGVQMALSYDTVANACIYLHTFYMRKSLFISKPSAELIAAVLFLAMKVSENRRSISDVIDTVLYVELIAKGSEETIDIPLIAGVAKEQFKRQMFDCELSVLETLEFQLDTTLPYDYLTAIAKHWSKTQPKAKDWLQTAWFFIDDSLHSPFCIFVFAQHIALLCAELALRFHKVPAKVLSSTWHLRFDSEMTSELMRTLVANFEPNFKVDPSTKARLNTARV